MVQTARVSRSVGALRSSRMSSGESSGDDDDDIPGLESVSSSEVSRPSRQGKLSALLFSTLVGTLMNVNLCYEII